MTTITLNDLDQVDTRPADIAAQVTQAILHGSSRTAEYLCMTLASGHPDVGIRALGIVPEGVKILGRW
jgi:hypothetical protein